MDESDQIVILNPSGEELYRTDDYFVVYNACQTEDGSVYWIMDDENLTTKLAKSRSGALPEEMWDMRQWYAGGSISFYGHTCLGGKGDEPCYSRLLKSGLGKIWS